MSGCKECKDIYKKPCEQLNYLNVADSCTDLRKFVDEIRVEVIDECKRAIVNTESKIYNPYTDKTWNELDLLASRQFEILDILEKLKENK